MPLPAEPILRELTEAYSRGNRKVTLLGGEPTLQPSFFKVVEHAAALGFEEIVVFTNGVKTSREWFVKKLLSLGAPLSFRISLQGATKEAHERTTKRPRSFDRIEKSMALLHEAGCKMTVNMCVVETNYASVPFFPELLKPYGVSQLHLDMMRPLDAGIRTEEELRAREAPAFELWHPRRPKTEAEHKVAKWGPRNLPSPGYAFYAATILPVTSAPIRAGVMASSPNAAANNDG